MAFESVKGGLSFKILPDEMRKRFNAPRKEIRDAINKRFKDRLKRD